MLKIDRDAKTFTRLQRPNMSDVGLTERYDLQNMIKNSPDAFFQEMGENLLLIGDEVHPTDFVDDRIDLLAVDQQGALVVIELKRGSKKLQLLQALSYASMVSKWEQSQIVAQLQQFAGGAEEDVEEQIEQFLLQDVATLNDSQRMILVAENYDYEVLATAEWLSEAYDVDIRCFRLALSAEGQAEFVTCTCIYPPPEITKHAVRRGRKGKKASKWSDWDEALAPISNKAVVDFFRSELKTGRENHLAKRTLYYRFNGARRFALVARQKAAYVWQNRRFPDDHAYWAKTIGDHINSEPVKKGRGLRFYLSESRDFEQFVKSLNGDLQTVEFADDPFEDEEGGDEEVS